MTPRGHAEKTLQVLSSLILADNEKVAVLPTKEKQAAVDLIEKLLVKNERLRVAVRALNKCIRERRYTLIRQRNARIFGDVERLLAELAMQRGASQDGEWLWVRRKDYQSLVDLATASQPVMASIDEQIEDGRSYFGHVVVETFRKALLAARRQG